MVDTGTGDNTSVVKVADSDAELVRNYRVFVIKMTPRYGD